MAVGRIFVAKESGSAEVGGETFVFTRNVTRVREGHPLLSAVPDYFHPVNEHVHLEWEVAEAPSRAEAAPRAPRGGK